MPLGINGKENPTPGYRSNGSSGVLYFVGYYGFSWSYAMSGINGLDLNLSSQSLNPSYSDYRALGFQLRCLSE
ncbi:hypothetical protein [uncultured Rikenella sp.]|uniref:hypothetical protein n=1 Tax=uncultured Rikenella sp. TaxID=368003 RepID=UPI00261D1AC0|nr:hypothetical protein [uncultured Rikenella sp.]